MQQDYQKKSAKIFKIGLSAVLIYLVFFLFTSFFGSEEVLGMVLVMMLFMGVVMPIFYTAFAVEGIIYLQYFYKKLKILAHDKYLVMNYVGIVLCFIPLTLVLFVLAKIT